MRVSHLVASLLTGTAASASFAVAITVNNPSFEDAGAGVPSWSSSSGGGSGSLGHYQPLAASYASIPDGVEVAWLDSRYASIAQTTAEPLTAGRIYQFSVYLGERANGPVQPRTWISLLPASELADFLANPVASATDYLAITQVEPTDVAPGTFSQFSVNFDTTSPANAALMSLYAGQNMVVAVNVVADGETDVDLASFSYSVVPEPASLALAAPAAMALLRRRRVM